MDVDVLTVGEATVDAFLSLSEYNSHLHQDDHHGEICFIHGDKIPVSSYEFLVGGNANNVAVGLARLAVRSSIAAEVGTDDLSEKILANLKKENVDTKHIVRAQGSSSFSVVINYLSERTVFVQNVQREHGFLFKDIKPRWIYLTSLGEKWIEPYAKALEFARDNSIKIAFNPGHLQIDTGYENIADILKHTSVLFVNKEEAGKILSSKSGSQKPLPQEANDLLAEVAALGPKVVVITDGAQGSHAIDKNGKVYFLPGSQDKAVERTGAGDAFATGFLGALFFDKDISQAIAWGTKNAISVISRIGAQAGLLTREQIEKAA